MDLLLHQVGIVAVMLLLGWTFGSLAESRHRRGLRRRQAILSYMLLSDIKTFPGGVDPHSPTTLVVAEAVIATDYLKSFLATIRKILGGEVRSYLSLMERARSEALLRIMEQARQCGCDAICNVRLETAAIGGMTKKAVAMVGVIASGTAYRRPGGPPQ